MAPLSRRREFFNATLRVLLDFLCITGIFAVTVTVMKEEGSSWIAQFRNFLPYLVTMTLVWFLVATDQRLFLSRRSEALVALLFSVAKSFFTAFLFTVFIVALFLGELNAYGIQFLPKLAPVLMFVFMAIVLSFKPKGLFGERE